MLKYGNLQFAVVEDKKELDLNGTKSYDAIIITKTNPLFVQNLVQRIRVSKDENIYLKPVFVNGDIDDLDPTTESLIDGSLASTNNLMHVSERVNVIKNKIKELN